MNRLIKLILIITAVVIFNSCEDILDGELFLNTEIESIEYGTSFGECTGYCINSIEITSSQITFTSTGWDFSENLSDISITVDHTSEEWNDLINSINYLAFRNLEEVIGCPDCEDGGAEWVKIVANGVSHKVTFEFGNEPEELEEIIDDLRINLDQFIN